MYIVNTAKKLLIKIILIAHLITNSMKQFDIYSLIMY